MFAAGNNGNGMLIHITTKTFRRFTMFKLIKKSLGYVFQQALLFLLTVYESFRVQRHIGKIGMLHPKYIGFDVSETAIISCKKRFRNDKTKTFFLLNEYADRHTAELVLSLDVIYHLIEENVFEEHINRLFQASVNFVIIYACDFDGKTNYHVKSRNFTKYIKEKIVGWGLIEHMPNKYPYNKLNPDNTSSADFYIYSKIVGDVRSDNGEAVRA